MKSVFCRFLKYESRRIKRRFCPLCGRLAKGQEGPDDGKHDGGQQVGDFDFFAPDQVETHTEDEDVAGERQI